MGSPRLEMKCRQLKLLAAGMMEWTKIQRDMHWNVTSSSMTLEAGIDSNDRYYRID